MGKDREIDEAKVTCHNKVRVFRSLTRTSANYDLIVLSTINRHKSASQLLIKWKN